VRCSSHNDVPNDRRTDANNGSEEQQAYSDMIDH
jgi:hypothetical protein